MDTKIHQTRGRALRAIPPAAPATALAALPLTVP